VDGFRELYVYRRSVVLATRLRGLIGQWHTVDIWTCGIQLVRAADSIGANIAEAHGRDTYRDRRRQLYVARGSAFELEHWLLTAGARGLMEGDQALDEAQQISRMLNALARRWSQVPDV
jgi:four helix bundle protein